MGGDVVEMDLELQGDEYKRRSTLRADRTICPLREIRPIRSHPPYDLDLVDADPR
jgi:hypothetical protein